MLILINSLTQTLLKQLFSLKWLRFLLLLFLIASCASSRFNTVKKAVVTQLNAPAFNEQFTGFLVVDLATRDTLFSANAKKYFTPASTVKLFTLYTALKMLDKRTPLLKYHEQRDSLYIAGTGNPAFLHPHFKDSSAITFLNRYNTIFLSVNHYIGEKYGPGWAWEDYPFYFSAEISPLPLYGNVLEVLPGKPWQIQPKLFTTAIATTDGEPTRTWSKNQFYLPEQLQDTIEIPFITSDSLVLQLLGPKINGKIRLSEENPPTKANILYGVATDSILKRMLAKSDNFLAEQTMLMVSAVVSDTLSFALARDHVLEHHLSTLRQPPRWVDGSGLSRYNLFSPEAMVAVLTQLYQETDTTRLFSLLPRWNKDGTLDEKSEDFKHHFLLAKSGSMGNTYNLSGYLRTTSGKLLAFSFMNNHFRSPSREVRARMYSILKGIHSGY